jgi:orotate phosphoribosyltransferase-like protein
MAAKLLIDRDKMMQLWQDGLTDEEIAQELGCSYRTIGSMRIQEGEKEAPTNKGIFKWQTKLSASELEKIPEKYRYAN